MSDSILYRLYQPADFAQLYAVEELCFERPFRFSRAYMRRLVQSQNGATWIAEARAQLAGFAIVEWARAHGETSAYIETIEVDPAWRRRGISTELMRRVEDSARAARASTIWLHVDAGNFAAIRLYEGREYARQGREEHFYARHRAALVYAKSLSSSDA